MEKAIGTFRFVIVYFTSGIMGFILGANFAGNGIASTGCSGALFGIIALVLLV
jgi:membrane associated rhomboid family serine protease